MDLWNSLQMGKLNIVDIVFIRTNKNDLTLSGQTSDGESGKLHENAWTCKKCACRISPGVFIDYRTSLIGSGLWQLFPGDYITNKGVQQSKIFHDLLTNLWRIYVGLWQEEFSVASGHWHGHLTSLLTKDIIFDAFALLFLFRLDDVRWPSCDLTDTSIWNACLCFWRFLKWNPQENDCVLVGGFLWITQIHSILYCLCISA